MHTSKVRPASRYTSPWPGTERVSCTVFLSQSLVSSQRTKTPLMMKMIIGVAAVVVVVVVVVVVAALGF